MPYVDSMRNIGYAIRGMVRGYIRLYECMSVYVALLDNVQMLVL